MACFVDSEWLGAVKGKVFFYPSAGKDWSDALDAFAGHINSFWFADIGYPAGLRMSSVQGMSSRFRMLESTRSGEPNAVLLGENLKALGLRPCPPEEVGA